MQDPIRNRDADGDGRPEFWASLLVMGFGLLLLFYLVAIDRQDWFSLRPASGTAQAMALAADKPLPTD